MKEKRGISYQVSSMERKGGRFYQDEDDEPTKKSEENTMWHQARFGIPPHNVLRES